MAKAKQAPKITISGVTFSAEQVKTAVVTIDGRDIFIGEKTVETPKMGFPTTQISSEQKGK